MGANGAPGAALAPASGSSSSRTHRSRAQPAWSTIATAEGQTGHTVHEPAEGRQDQGRGPRGHAATQQDQGQERAAQQGGQPSVARGRVGCVAADQAQALSQGRHFRGAV